MGTLEGAFQAALLAVNPGNTAWRFGRAVLLRPRLEVL